MWFGLEGILKDIYIAPPPAVGWVAPQIGLPTVPSMPALGTSRQQCQCLTALITSNVFLVSNLNLLSFGFKPLPFSLDSPGPD